jgi:hypothetical protein
MWWPSAAALFLLSCATGKSTPPVAARAVTLDFGPQRQLGDRERNPGTPFLRHAPDGRLFAVWTEDHDKPWPQGRPSGHQHGADRMASPMRNAMISSSADGGKTWTGPRRVNNEIEAVQGEENGPKVAIGADKRAFVVWSIPGAKGDKTRANIRFAMDDGNGGLSAARTLNEVKDAARFPVVELAPDGNLFIAWIDRRIDGPEPRQLYLMRMNPNGDALTKNFQVGAGLCECCKLGVAFADGGKTVYLVDREVDGNKIRNHVLRKSTDGGVSFGAPVEISNDGWQVPSCPHSGPSLGLDSRGQLHVSWFTLGRKESEAGIYYSVSKDGGNSFSPRQLVHANTAPETLYNHLVVADDDTVFLAWSNLDGNGRAQIYFRTLSADGQKWSPIQQLSNAKGNASRPSLALRRDRLHIAWTEIDGEDSRVVMKSAAVRR